MLYYCCKITRYDIIDCVYCSFIYQISNLCYIICYVIETNSVYWIAQGKYPLVSLVCKREKSSFRIVRSITAMIREIDSETGPLNVDLKGALLKKSTLPKSWKPTRSMPRCWCEGQEDTFVLALVADFNYVINYY